MSNKQKVTAIKRTTPQEVINALDDLKGLAEEGSIGGIAAIVLSSNGYSPMHLILGDARSRHDETAGALVTLISEVQSIGD